MGEALGFTPGRALHLEVASWNPDGWFAFSAPRKMGRLGYWVRVVLDHRTLWLKLAFLGFAVVLIGPIKPREARGAPNAE